MLARDSKGLLTCRQTHRGSKAEWKAENIDTDGSGCKWAERTNWRNNGQNRQWRYNAALRRVRVTIFRVKKQMIVTYYDCVSVAYLSSMQSACALLPSVACPALQYFSTLSHKRHGIREKVIEHKMCVLIFSTTFVRNISHSKKNSERYYHKCA
jgi:hypothetical protein